MKLVIGIDPGKSGGLCVIKDGRIMTLIGMPETNKDLYDFLVPYGKLGAVAYLEKVGAMPGQGVTSMFTFGKGYGALEMALVATGISTVSITPQKWQKFFSFGSRGELSKTDWKKKLRMRAEQLFPKNKISLQVADAVLISKCGWEMEKQNPA